MHKGFRFAPWISKTCELCGKTFEVMPYRAATARFCCHVCRQTAVSRATARRRGDAQRGRGDGKTYRKYCGRHEHRVIAERMLGRALRAGEIVHHRDGNKLNNAPENLCVLLQSEHVRGHYSMMLQRRREVAGY